MPLKENSKKVTGCLKLFVIFILFIFVLEFNSLLEANPKLSEDLRVDKVSSKENEFIQNFTFLNISFKEVTEEEVRDVMHPVVKNSICIGDTAEYAKEFFARKITLSYSYKETEGNELLYMSFTEDSCNET